MTAENTAAALKIEADADAKPAAGDAALLLVARQALYDRAKTVTSYELLYRRSEKASKAEVIDGNKATLQVITNSVLEIGLDRLADDLPVHINYPQELLIKASPLVAPYRATLPMMMLSSGTNVARFGGKTITLPPDNPLPT